MILFIIFTTLLQGGAALNTIGFVWQSGNGQACDCDVTRWVCCSYHTDFGLVPGVTWGTTPAQEQYWYNNNNCNVVMGGTAMSNCPYVCSQDGCNVISSGRQCPESHPFAYRPDHNFDYCCSTNVDCRNVPWASGGDRECCQGQNYTPCPYGSSCEDNEDFTWSCSTGSGASCATCQPEAQRTVANHCSACNSGYYLSGTSCVAYTCSTSSGTGCATCRGQSSRTGNNQCSACNPGYYLDGIFCLAYTCMWGSGGSSCATCLPQASMTADFQCASCHSGYYLSGTATCEAYTCSTTSSGAGCATCRSQSSRTASDQCTTCNPGYYLDGTSCSPYLCIRGSGGDTCATCPDQASMTDHGQCGSCWAGYYLNGGSCLETTAEPTSATREPTSATREPTAATQSATNEPITTVTKVPTPSATREPTTPVTGEPTPTGATLEATIVTLEPTELTGRNATSGPQESEDASSDDDLIILGITGIALIVVMALVGLCVCCTLCCCISMCAAAASDESGSGSKTVYNGDVKINVDIEGGRRTAVNATTRRNGNGPFTSKQGESCNASTPSLYMMGVAE